VADQEHPYDPYDREGLPQINAFPEWQRELERFRRGIKDVPHRRLYACRACDTLRSIVEELPIDDGRRNELTNLVNLTLRMILMENDGHVGSGKLLPF
jgi:hypothetical protein